MMNEHGKSDPAVVAAKLANKAERSAAEPVEPRGWDQGECKPATLGPDAEPGNRVTGAGAHTSNRKGKEEGTVHSALPPYQRRTAPGCVLCHQAGGSPRRRRGGMAGLRGKCGDKSPWLARARPTGSVSGTAVPASVHTQAGRPAAPARGRRPGRQDCPTGDGHTAQRDLRGGLPRFLVRFPARTQRAPRDGCARGWNREQEGELDTGRRYPIILRFDQPGMAGPLPGTSDRRPAHHSPDPEMAQGGCPGRRGRDAERGWNGAGIGDFAVACQYQRPHLYADRWRRREAAGDMIIVRYADDFIIGFQHETDGRRFLDGMRERLGKFAL